MGVFLQKYVREDEEGHSSPLPVEQGGVLLRWRRELRGPPGWERTSASKLNLRGTEVREILALDSIKHGHKFKVCLNLD